jgi:hypothetical protein
MNDDYHMFRPKRGWVPEWLWRIVKHVVRWEPFLTLFTEPENEDDWGKP